MQNLITDGISYFTGDELKAKVTSALAEIKDYKPRNAVKDIVKYCRKKSDTLFGIRGFRGTGKTTAIYDAIHRLNDYENTIYIKPERDVSTVIIFMYINNVLGFTIKKPEDNIHERRIKYLFFDDVSVSSDFLHNYLALYRTFLHQRAKRIIIAGDNPLVMTYTFSFSLSKNIDYTDMNFYSYSEAKRIENISFRDYLLNCGVFNKKITVVSEFKEYSDNYISAAFSEVLNSRNRRSFGSIDNFTIYSVSHDVIYSIVFNVFLRILFLNEGGELERFIYKRTYDGEFSKRTASYFGTEDLNKFEYWQHFAIIEKLEEIGLIKSAVNLAPYRDGDYSRFAICGIPSFMSSVCRGMSDIVGKDNIGSLLSMLWINTVMFHAFRKFESVNRNPCIRIGFYRDEDMESYCHLALSFDRYQRIGRNKRHLILFEFADTANASDAVYNSNAIKHTGAYSHDDISVIREYIIYRGKTRKFEGFSESYRKNHIHAREKEDKYIGTELINSESILENIDAYIDMLLDDVMN